MDHSHIDIEAIIRDANHQRSVALGKIISDGWGAFKQLLTGLRYRRPTRDSATANHAVFTGFHYLP